MILYHGTSTEHLAAILEQGILPRSRTGLAGNYDLDVPSNPDCVYLSSAYPLYYAADAVTADDADPVIIAVDVDEDDLFPDEDFIAECFRRADGSDWKETRKSLHPWLYKRHWRESLKHNGVVCTRSVLPDRIMDHRVIPWEGNGSLLLAMGADALPTMDNFAIFGELYRQLLSVLFAHQEIGAAARKIDEIQREHQEAIWGSAE